MVWEGRRKELIWKSSFDELLYGGVFGKKRLGSTILHEIPQTTLRGRAQATSVSIPSALLLPLIAKMLLTTIYTRYYAMIVSESAQTLSVYIRPYHIFP